MSDTLPRLDPRQTHTDYAPLVTVALVAHSGDAEFLGRAAKSLRAQTLPPTLMETVLTFDGPLDEVSSSYVEDAFKGCKFPVRVFWSDEKSGYYTLPRNRAFPMLRGHYVVHMDADNEFAPEHLWTLLDAIRNPGEGDEGWAHFAYTRRRYINDSISNGKLSLPDGPSPFVPWTAENVENLVKSPNNNFVDTGDFIIGRAVLYELAERTGYVWHPDLRRFADWELVKRLAVCGFRGKAVDAVTHIYYWTGKNVSTTSLSDFVALPEHIYEQMKSKGEIKE